MARDIKVLGQSAPSANSPTDVYTVPASTKAVISTIVVANRSTSSGTFRLAVRPAGAVIANQHYLVYDTPVAAKDSTTLTIGITLSSTDVVTVDSVDNDNFSYNIFGYEII